MYKSILLPSAREDILDAANWYNEKQNGLGKRFIFQVREKIGFIQQSPNACQIRYDDVRCSVLNLFPFMVHYIIDERCKTVIINLIILRRI